MDLGEPAARRPTVVAEPTWVFALLWVAFPLLGAGAGWLVRLAADWLVSLPWAPMQGPAELVSSLPEPHVTIGLVALGALAGLVVAFLARHESLTVEVARDRVVLARKGAAHEVPGESVAAAFLDGKDLVLLGSDTGELARESSDVDAERLAAAFREHRYRWLDDDPYREEFRRWVPDTPGLPAGANALFTARERALGRGGSEEDARELRDELAKLGVVVRDAEKRQYWRLARPDTGGTSERER
ncbi:YqeB family protein [Qaidamihabitans albus]|uniref:YqeB family protein n=1 Tax=Qaidamihabitans albus TaxID=2795733 RepID=UPI0018F2094D|nr:hypothetical protein [Qaidamihabitans albus]